MGTLTPMGTTDKNGSVPILKIRSVSEELRRQFKSHCALLGVSMNRRLIELMEKDVVVSDERSQEDRSKR